MTRVPSYQQDNGCCSTAASVALLVERNARNVEGHKSRQPFRDTP